MKLSNLLAKLTKEEQQKIKTAVKAASNKNIELAVSKLEKDVKALQERIDKLELKNIRHSKY